MALRWLTCNLDGRLTKIAWIAYGLIFAAFIGGRREIGADWAAYWEWHEFTKTSTLLEALSASDPGYMAVNWICARLNLGIIGVNSVCGVLFMVGLVSYCRREPIPWLAFYVAIPYLVIVVAMSYSRQGVAIGLALLAMIQLHRGSIGRFLLLLMVAILFHKSAALLLALLLTNYRIPLQARIAALLASLATAMVVVGGSTGFFINTYIEKEMVSGGTVPRLAINILPVLAALSFLKKVKAMSYDFDALKWMAILNVACFPLLALGDTAVDRIALYLIPLQISIWPRLVYSARSATVKFSLLFFVLSLYALLMVGWLQFANNRDAFVPYKSFIF